MTASTAETSIQTFDRARFARVCWSIYAILAASYILVFFHRIAPAVVSADLMRAFGTTGATLGSLAAVYYYIYTAMQIPAGVLADTLGARISVTLGNLVSGVGSILFGLAATFWEASVGRALVGLGVSVVFVGLMKSNTLWFRDRDYGFISGLTLLLGNVGAILAAGPLAGALTVWSWRAVFVAFGVMALILAVLSWLGVRNTPEDAGFPSIREMEGQARHAGREQHWWHDLLGVLATRRVWPGFWVNLGMPASLLAFLGLWAIPFLRDLHGLERSAASLYTTVALASFAGSTLFCGWFSDRLGRRKPLLVIGTLLYGLAWLGIVHASWKPGVLGMAWFVLMGFGCGSFALTYAGAKEIVVPALSGMAIALVNTGVFLGAAVIQPLFGWIMDLTWSGTLVNGVRVYGSADYRTGFFLMLGCVALAIGASLFFHETRCRNITLAD
ncbi:MAG: MFS transporter [Candidatus Contendobacter sp.]|nr:MFS transporter [Candidatus Contendobacter sp.]MDS4059626.1 MFS transporter [Candidatus Contendobacter sp.]